LFPDDSSPNGQHYCINSVSLDFEAKNNTQS
jgi:peptide methionine sulfoxide reductase MsrB